MRSLFFAVSGVAAVVAANTAHAQTSPLDPVSWLVGGEWVSELNPPKGDPITVRMTVEWTAHKQALKYTIYFKTKDAEFPQYDGLYYWHPGAKEIRLLQTDRGGGLTEAVITVADGKWSQKNVHTAKDGKKSDQRAEMTREGNDAFHFRAFVPKGDEWIEALNVKYKRVKKAPAK
jgi:hypothetical protein